MWGSIMTQAKIKSWRLNLLSHSDSPKNLLSYLNEDLHPNKLPHHPYSSPPVSVVLEPSHHHCHPQSHLDLCSLLSGLSILGTVLGSYLRLFGSKLQKPHKDGLSDKWQVY